MISNMGKQIISTPTMRIDRNLKFFLIGAFLVQT